MLTFPQIVSASLLRSNSWSFMVKGTVLGKLLGMRQVLKLNELVDDP